MRASPCSGRSWIALPTKRSPSLRPVPGKRSSKCRKNWNVNPKPSKLNPLVGLAAVLLGSAAAAPHPYHDDQGMIAWRPTWSAAVQEAKATGKPLYIELTHNDEEGAAFVTGTLI